ncbi:methyltransferase domain-containing protein [Paraburkholderia sp. CNPSo 3157]|uniref:Methyltransferase domain-containing protein n=1 Tax=Paraburkholderia franconis TaxID=2654983 RepID=A0A7X1N922_9BURK|nr:methyltransferase domain-containing protein [Paraburkholderia franconis]MPW17649.1 methyltransferase domain-containing protein [Paraburkholderia franconis]
MTNAALSALIERVKAEAATRTPAHQPLSRPALQLPGDSGRVRARGLQQTSASPADVGVERFMLGDNDDFIDEAYRYLLGRESDDSGRRHYRAQLANGVSRLSIAAKLRLSREGRNRGTGTDGLKWAMALTAFDSALRPLRMSFVTRSAMRRLERRVSKRAALLECWRAIEDIEARLDEHKAHVETSIETAVATARAAVAKAAQDESLVSQQVLDRYYLAFEDANRGSQESVSAKLAVYNDWLGTRVPGRRGLQHAIVDIGSGRGEWLAYVSAKHFDAVGVDANPVMVDMCTARGFDVQCMDALGYLRSLPSRSVGAVTGFHIIEHLPFDYLYALVAECNRVLVDGGSVLFETPNPENVLVGSHTFYHDFTHRNPVTPSAITFLLQYHGFDDIDIIRSSPYPEEAKVPGNDPLTERVNGHLCGPQDFAVTGRKARAAGDLV